MESPREKLIFVAISSLAFLGGLCMILFLHRWRLRLGMDSISVRGLVSTRTLLRSEIVAWRIIPTEYVSTLELTPRSPEQKKYNSVLLRQPDTAFLDWFELVPNPDVLNLVASEARVSADTGAGTTPEERLQNLARAKKTAWILTTVAIALFFWAVVNPQPYRLIIAILIALPWVAVFLISRNKSLYQLEGRRNDVRPELLACFLLPSCALALRTLLDFQLLIWAPIIKLTLISTVFLAVLLYIAIRDLRPRWWNFLGFVLFLSFYCLGALGQVNAFWDSSPTKVFAVKVIEKRFSDSSRDSWRLLVGSWGPRGEHEEVEVSRSLYDAIQFNESVCIHLKSGALRISWYIVTTCR